MFMTVRGRSDFFESRSSLFRQCSRSKARCSWAIILFMTVHYSSSCSFHLTSDAIPVHLDGVPCLKQSVQARTNNVCSWVLILFKLYWSSFVFVHVMFLYMTVQGRSTYLRRRSSSLRRRSWSKTMCSFAY